MKQREPRRTVAITARMKSSNGWQDVAITNVSSHGMRISVAMPPRRGAYIEIRRSTQIIVARTMWVENHDCGLRTQDAVDIPALLTPHAARAERVVAEAAADRRRAPRAADVAARSRHAARLFQGVVIAGAVVAASLFIAIVVRDALQKPFAAVERAMNGAPP